MLVNVGRLIVNNNLCYQLKQLTKLNKRDKREATVPGCSSEQLF